MKKIAFLLVICIVNKTTALAQQPSTEKVPHIAVFSPLYLDSVFGEKGYKYGKLIPPFAIQGVEYYYGANAAIDSLKIEGVKAKYTIFDSKSAIKNVSTLIANGDLADVDMIIGAVSGTDVKALADYAAKKGIPFISATFPNDANVTNNPNFVIINSTLKTNCQQLHHFVQAKLKDQRVVLFSKEGKQEERITNYFKEFEKNSTLGSLAINYVNLGNDVSEENILRNIDSMVLSSYIIASTDAAFAKTIAQVLIKNNLQEQSNILGLPTWDDATEFNKKEYKGLFFYYVNPTPRNTTSVGTKLQNTFKLKYGIAPGDNMLRGYETIYKYTKLWHKHQQNLGSNLTDKSFSAVAAYDIQPVMLDANNMTLDYFENKKVYIMKRYNGVTTQLVQ